jgi:hypothetical protein
LVLSENDLTIGSGFSRASVRLVLALAKYVLCSMPPVFEIDASRDQLEPVDGLPYGGGRPTDEQRPSFLRRYRATRSWLVSYNVI